ncbi:MAG: FtsQ-type POTRA domain-containing protein [Verrucomicrobia bacterium]|nr:FtsQ-type POTRA domain-containing protein [Verrucomicrobiota bacterium]
MSHSENHRLSSRSSYQGRLLEVNIREDKERRRRLISATKFIGKTILLLATLTGLGYAAKEGWTRFVWKNPDLLISAPIVQTDGTLTRDQILLAGNVVEGKNILTINLNDVRRGIEKLPQVERAEVSRNLPNHLGIQVVERRPIAWVTSKKSDDLTTSPRSFLIDARGMTLRSQVILPEYYHLPVISGVITDNFTSGQRVTEFNILAALELIQINSENARFQIRHIDLGKSYCLIVTDQRHAQITFGFQRLDAQLTRLNQVIDSLEPSLILNKPEAPSVTQPESEVPLPKPAEEKANNSKSRPASPEKKASTKNPPTPTRTTPPPLPPIKDTTPKTKTPPTPAQPWKKHFEFNG